MEKILFIIFRDYSTDKSFFCYGPFIQKKLKSLSSKTNEQLCKRSNGWFNRQTEEPTTPETKVTEFKAVIPVPDLVLAGYVSKKSKK